MLRQYKLDGGMRGRDKVVFLFHSNDNWSAMSALNNLVEDGWLIREELGINSMSFVSPSIAYRAQRTTTTAL
jgi:hypothetical protein